MLFRSKIWYYSDGNSECDFIFQKNEDYFAIQVCYALNGDNQEREINGFQNLHQGNRGTKNYQYYFLQFPRPDQAVRKGGFVIFEYRTAWIFFAIILSFLYFIHFYRFLTFLFVNYSLYLSFHFIIFNNEKRYISIT